MAIVLLDCLDRVVLRLRLGLEPRDDVLGRFGGGDGDAVERAQEAAQDVKNAGGDALPLVGDVRVPAEVDRLTSEATDWLGGLDSLVTVVGGYSLFTPWTPLADVTDDQWSLIMDLNLTYVFRFTRAALKVFVSQGSGGSIVSIGSISGT